MKDEILTNFESLLNFTKLSYFFIEETGIKLLGCAFVKNEKPNPIQMVKILKCDKACLN